jgi:hypothetical protein
LGEKLNEISRENNSSSSSRLSIISQKSSKIEQLKNQLEVARISQAQKEQLETARRELE